MPLFVFLLLAAATWAAPSLERATLDKYCVGCHNSKVKLGAFVVDAANVHQPNQAPEAWEKVIRKLRGRYMPPQGAPRPDERTYDALTASLEQTIDRAASLKPKPGRTESFRRLTRTEYQNSIRDLLALDVDVTSLLPADESSHGFDNVTVADLSPTLMERYLSAARKISRLAVGSPVRSVGGDTFNIPPDVTQEEHVDDLPIGTRGGKAIRYTFPLDGYYEVQLRLARDRNEHIEGLREKQQLELLLDGQPVKRFEIPPAPKGGNHTLLDKHLNIRIPVKAGPHRLAATFLKQPSLLLETERQPYQAHFNMDRHPRITPALYSITVNGPYEPQGPGKTPSRDRILVCSGKDETCAGRIFSTLMKRAYRRPVAAADLQVPLKFFRDSFKDGFDAGIEMGLSAVLVSPEFLFHVERDPAGVAPKTAYSLSDLELASRVSFFLWSSIPDDELLNLAIAKKLRQPSVLQKQVQRMLADRRSQVLVTNFAEQWLHLRNLASITPDMRIFPDFDDNLRQAFRKETQLFFESIMREDRSALDLLRANFTFINERLAKHYGIPNIYGSRFRRIETDSARGGLLRQGSMLTVTSYATRTSPVIRGKWILDNILGAPPQPPPPFVPALKETAGKSGKPQSMRERIAEHRANPACSGCHNLMDPLGFAFENYDAVGRWRELEDHTPIDTSGSLPDGRKFTGVADLQNALLARPELFVTTFTEKLLTYALGRGVTHLDAPAVRKIVKDASANEFRFSSIVTGIVGSTPFQMRSSQ